jgi:hypothetical protein
VKRLWFGLAAIIVGAILPAYAAVNIGAAPSSVTPTVALASGETVTATCSGTRLTADKLDRTSQVLACTGTVTTTTLPPVTTTSAPAGNTGTVAMWVPGTAPIEWQWILSRPLTTADIQPGITVYDIDGFDHPASTVAAIHAAGDHAVCYIDVGTAENFRPDYASFPAALLGKTNGWPGERWVNTSPSGPDYSTLQSIMTARFAMCAAKGFDAVEPDNIDGSENSTGFALSTADSVGYARWFAAAVHALGMSVAQKNFVDQSAALVGSFDFALDEQCAQYSECGALAPYPAAGKAVFEAEYKASNFCTAANAANRDAALFDLNLDGKTYQPCR